MRSGPADFNLLARGASNAKWHSGCLAPDRCVESICDWLIRGPLFLRRRNSWHRHSDRDASASRMMTDTIACPHWLARRDFAHGPNGGLRAIGDADFSQDVLDVFFHRLVADAQ